MVSSARRILISVLLLAGTAICTSGQTTLATGSISGKVTIKGAPAVRVTVVATDIRLGSGPHLRPHRARTDQTGSYRLTNLPAGTYEISALTPALLSLNQSDSIVVDEGQGVENVDLTLVPGGVITGRVTDSEGEPVIGEPVHFTPVGATPSPRISRAMFSRVYSSVFSTDDRGVYRAFGLPSGSYNVSVGSAGTGLGNSRQLYKQTFYPSVSDAAKATIVEVSEGSEKTNIDIVVGHPVETFNVAGRVVNGETKKPVTGIKYGLGQSYNRGQSSGSSSSIVGVTNSNGEFRFENLTPGKYTVFTAPEDGDTPAASTSFEVVDRDLSELLITTTRGGSLSGVVMLESNESAPAVITQLRLCAMRESSQVSFGNASASEISQDGRFRINGLRSGRTSLWLCSNPDNRRQFEIVRLERNGVVQPNNFDVKEREQLSGIQVTVKVLKLTGTIRGHVNTESGELPPPSQLSLMVWPLDENLEPKRNVSIPRTQIDARGNFLVEGLAAGVYQVRVVLLSPERIVTEGGTRQNVLSETKKQVTITDDTVTEVTLTIKPQPNPD